MLLKLSPWREPSGQEERFAVKAADAKLLVKDSGDFRTIRKQEYVEKASTLAARDPEGGTDDTVLWVRAEAGNPFLRDMFIMETGDVSSIQLPQLESVPALQDTAAINPALDGAAGDLPDPGELINVSIRYYDNYMRASLSAVEDLPDFRRAYSVMTVEQILKESGRKVVADIKANSLVADQNTGVANGLPTTANIVDKLGEVIEDVEAQFHGNGVLHVAPAIWRLLSTASNSNLSSDYGYQTWNGVPLVVNGALDPGTANGQVPAIFGDFYRGYFFAVRTDITIQEGINNGIPFFYGAVRFGGAVWDWKALGKLVVGA